MSRPPALARRMVMVDTSAYFALTSPRDTNHGTAQLIARELAHQQWQLITTNFLLAEIHALLLNRINGVVAGRMLQSIEQGTTKVIRVTEADESRAREILTLYNDKDFTLTDATTFAIMVRLRIGSVFSFDKNFTQYGLIVLTPDHFSQR